MVQAMDWNPQTITWQETYPDGTRYSVLEGVRDVPGTAFTYAFFMPAGFWDPAHAHTADARVVVVQGAMHLGFGTTTDKAAARIFPVGGYLLVPANAVHYDGAETDTIIIGTAIGPWKTTYVGEE